MALGDDKNPLDVRIVDLLGSVNLQQLTENMGSFRQEIDQLKASIDALSVNIAEATRAQKNLAEGINADFYKSGHSAQASRSGGGLLGPDGQPISSAGMGPSEGHSSGFFNSLRQSLTASGREALWGNMTPIDLPNVSQGGYSNPSRGGGGGGGGTGGASSGSSRPFAQLPETPEPLLIPQFGEFQADSLLRTMGGIAQRTAERRHRNNPDTEGAGLRSAQAAYGLYKAAEYIPNYKIAQQYASNYHTAMAPTLDRGLAANAYGTGGQFGPLSVPFLNQTFTKGVEEKFQQVKRSASKGGINSEQVGFIDQQLSALGYTGGQGGGSPSDNLVDRYREGYDGMMQSNKRMAQNPNTPLLMDKALRYGNADMNEFFTLLTEGYPKAADVAHVTQEQMVQDALQLAETYEKMGGTAMQAVKDTEYFTGVGGLPPAVMEQYMQNPFYQSAAFRSTGLMPNAQASMSGGQKISAMIQSVNELGTATSGFETLVNKAPGKLGDMGLKTISGGWEQQIGLMAQHTDMSPDVLRQLMDPQTRQVKKGYSQLMQAMLGSGGYADQFNAESREVRWGGKTPVEALLDGRTTDNDPNIFTKGEAFNEIRQARIPGEKGEPDFIVGQKYKKEIDEIANYRSADIAQIRKGGVHNKEWDRLEQIISEQQQEMERFVTDKGLPDGLLPDAADPNKTYIELRGEAAKHFRLVTSKDDANRGDGRANDDAASAGSTSKYRFAGGGR